MHNGDKKLMYTASIGIIVFIICFTAALFLVPLKEIFIKPDYGYFFGSSGKSFIVASICIAVLGVSIMIMGWEMKSKLLKFVISFPICIASLIGLYYSIDDYYYIDPNGIVIDTLETTEERLLKWEDITELVHIYRKDQTGAPLPSELIIKLKDGEEILMELGPRQYSMRTSINSTVRKFGGESFVDFYDSEGNFIERKEYF
ncbi:hypothetical protein GCM10008967_32700 [Bacillus carboniphilus]|uniref:Uncharacterized protein n=1 Tax=Bacillus carboniphilus TaxID=86663 RepID=A0ABP3G933_9BACI